MQRSKRNGGVARVDKAFKGNKSMTQATSCLMILPVRILVLMRIT
jgi:hypothetical protein